MVSLPASGSVSTAIAVKTVLVADDTAFVRDRYTTALSGGGHRAIAVRTLAELLARVEEEGDRIDLLLLDLQLPQGRGVELVKTLRRKAFRAPIIVFSGTVPKAKDVGELTALGVAGYMNEYTAAPHILRTLAPHLFPEQHNRRSSPRVALGVPVSYRLQNTIAAALTLNVSTGGLAVRAPKALEPGTVVKVRFRIPEAKKDVEAEARVAWVDNVLGMGLQFTSLQPADHAAIDAFVFGRFFSNRRA
jgi:uncharacterized protein (TIGR02266 family)